MPKCFNGYNYHTFSAKIYFSLLKVKKKRKKGITNFVSLFRSRNMIEWFVKTYLHKPIKILQLLSFRKIQKYLP